MTEQLRRQIRLALLRMMHEAHPFPLAVSHLHDGLVAAGTQVNDTQVKSELDALFELGFATSAPDGIAGGIMKWKRTEKGRLQLVEAGFIGS